MADDMTEETLGPRADEDEENEESQAPEKKGKPKIVLLIAGVVVIAVLAAVGYFVFASSTKAELIDVEEGIEESGESGASRREKGASRSRRGGNSNVESTNIFFTDFPAAVVNLGLSEKYEYVYLKYRINLELADEDPRAELTLKMPKLLSIIDSVVSGRPWEQISSKRGRKSLENEIVDTLNDELENGGVIGCYFETFVAQ